MSFALHHGPNGSYKTFSVVQRFVIKALYDGRCVVTNIRGMDNIDNIAKAFNKPLPPMAELIFIDWEDPEHPENLEALQRWFHWIPFGSLFVLDECHNFYPEDTKTFLKTLDSFEPESEYYIEPIGGESFTAPSGKEIFRPKDILNAFRMHRHYEWDIFFTTPDVDFLPKKIRLSTEFCYRHRNLEGLVPFKKGKWKEVQHSARTNGDSQSSQIQSAEYKLDKRVFNCYSSTATGTYKKSIAGKSVLGGGKIKIVFFLWLLAVSYFVYSIIGITSDDVSAEEIEADNNIHLQESFVKDSNISSGITNNQLSDEKLHKVNGLKSKINKLKSDLKKQFGDFFIVGYTSIGPKVSYILSNKNKDVIVTSRLLALGYTYESFGKCKLSLIDNSSDAVLDIYCPIKYKHNLKTTVKQKSNKLFSI